MEKHSKFKIVQKGNVIRIMSIFLLIILIVVLGIIIYRWNVIRKQTESPILSKNEMNFEGMTASEVVSAYGVTSMGMIEETFPLEEISEGLEVEEILVKAGEAVNETTPVLKFTEESVSELKETLEKALQDAELAYRSGKIEYEQKQISAEYEYEKSILEGKQAESVYETTISNLTEQVEKTKKEYEDAKAELAEYEAALEAGTYKLTLEQCEQEYDENYSILVQYMEEWGVSWSEVTGKGNADQYVTTLRSMYSVLEANQKALQEAEAEYEEKVINQNLTLQSLRLSVSELSEAYVNAQAEYESSLVKAKLTMETALTEAELAGENYRTTLEKAEADFTALEDTKKTAETNLTTFESRMEGGYYYPAETGTILRVSVQKGREISSGDVVFMISNAEEMTVEVSVSQNDIAKIKIGDSAIIVSDTSGNVQGEITEINPFSTSDSRSSVAYTVTVRLLSGTGQLSANETVSVYIMLGGNGEK